MGAVAKEDGLAGLTRTYRGALVAFFVRRTGNYSAAEDLTQEAFTRMAARPADALLDRPDSYLFRVAANLLTDYRRRQAVRLETTGDEHDAALLEGESWRDEINPERVLQAKETLITVQASLSELSERTRHIFVLNRLDGLSQSEIAALLGLSVSTVEREVVKAAVHIGKRLRKR